MQEQLPRHGGTEARRHGGKKRKDKIQKKTNIKWENQFLCLFNPRNNLLTRVFLIFSPCLRVSVVKAFDLKAAGQTSEAPQAGAPIKLRQYRNAEAKAQ
jgi:hypothetical protein